MTAPDKLVLVPVEPTIDMIAAGNSMQWDDEGGTFSDNSTRVYRAMIASAPTAPDPMRAKMMKAMEEAFVGFKHLGNGIAEVSSIVEVERRHNRLGALQRYALGREAQARALLAELTAQSETKEK